MTDAKREAIKRWHAQNLETVSAQVPKGYREKLKAIAEGHGLTLNRYLRMLYEREIEEAVEGSTHHSG